MDWTTKPHAPRLDRQVRPTTRAGVILVGAALLLLAGGAGAYDKYSVNGDATNCRACHGDFRASPYTSLTDGLSWGDGLHDVHRYNMLSGDCDTCHSSGPKGNVLIGSSNGGAGLPAISCSGCHGRVEDGTGNGSEGYGAGLRQHHWRAKITTCGTCHSDADPALFTPVEEDFLPPYYAADGTDPAHPLIPADPCNLSEDGRPEDYAASTLGLDNDGDDLYDEDDVIACPEPGKTLMLASGLGFLLALGRRRR
jgi:hypothetical protein